MIYGIIILVILVLSSIGDIKKQEINLWEILACLVVSIIRVVADYLAGSFDMAEIIVCLLPGAFLIAMGLLTRQSVGYGDGLLALSAAPALGATATCFGLLSAIFICGLASALLMVIKRVGKNFRIPFVPFMTLGMGVAMFATF